MSSFREYMHIEKFGNTGVEGIELGQVYVFPKLDGTNASVWSNKKGQLFGGSRTRMLGTGPSDNAGFYGWVLGETHNLYGLCTTYPNFRLYGEWLVPHTFKGYREDAWKRFYIFDVYDDQSEMYLPYETYKPLLDEYGLDYIPPLATIKNGRYEHFLEFLAKNKYLCPNEGEPGEGIVIKNYDFYNKFGNQVWAKLIRQEFKDEHHKVMGAPDVNTGLLNEDRIVTQVVTSHLIDKTIAKIKTDKGGWSSKNIPELFERVFYDVVTEELWDQWKELKFGTINGKTLKALTIQKIKQLKPELF